MFERRIFIALYLFLAPFAGMIAHAQNNEFQEWLNRGKSEFRASRSVESTGDSGRDSILIGQYLRNAVDNLERAVKINPESQEAQYFLGYAYSWLFSHNRGGEVLESTRLENTRLISRHLEKVIALSPKYDGELVVLGPYSKLSSEWGSLALAYASKGYKDSAKWAFQEGRRAGGFQLVALEHCRNILKSCSKDAILLVSGDDVTFPMWYLQSVEGYRQDVSIVCTSLLGTAWYPKWLGSNRAFGAVLREISTSDKEIDRMYPQILAEPKEYRVHLSPDVLGYYDISNGAAELNNGNLTFSAPGTIYETADRQITALSMQDMLLMDIITTNGWKRPIYSYIGLPREEITSIGLERNMKNAGLVMQLQPVPVGDDIDAQVDGRGMEELLMDNGDDNFSFDAWDDDVTFHDPDALPAAFCYIEMAVNLGDYRVAHAESAGAILEPVIRIQEIISPERFPEPYVQNCRGLAYVYEAAGQPEQARVWRERCR